MKIRMINGMIRQFPDLHFEMTGGKYLSFLLNANAVSLSAEVSAVENAISIIDKIALREIF
jgi:hypothetical protein